MDLVKMTEVISSNISRIGFDETSGNVFVEFRTGKMYVYENVGKEIYNKFLTADSKGKFVNSYLRENFVCRQLQKEGK